MFVFPPIHSGTQSFNMVRVPYLSRKPLKTYLQKQIRFLRKERWLKRIDKESTPRMFSGENQPPHKIFAHPQYLDVPCFQAHLPTFQNSSSFRGSVAEGKAAFSQDQALFRSVMYDQRVVKNLAPWNPSGSERLPCACLHW